MNTLTRSMRSTSTAILGVDELEVLCLLGGIERDERCGKLFSRWCAKGGAVVVGVRRKAQCHREERVCPMNSRCVGGARGGPS